jgi:RNA polymerase-binding transcription factor DksA
VDDADRAQIQEEAMLDFAIRAARGILGPERESASDCVDCGMAISSARQLAVPGCQLCTDCAERVESLRARGLL